MNPAIVGIDISAADFRAEVSCATGAQKRKFTNDTFGFERLQHWVSQHSEGPVVVCMEATGRYGDALAAFAHSRGYFVLVVNPLRIRRYAEALGILGKDDKVDAHAVTEFAKDHWGKLRPWTPKTEAQQELRDLRCHLRGLEKAKRAIANRLASGISTTHVVRASQQLISEIDKQIADAERRAAQIVAADRQLQSDKNRVQTQIGFGPKCSMALVTYIDFRSFRSGRQVARIVGLTPKREQSGTSLNRRGHISKQGPADLRGLLWNAARSAIKNDPTMRAFADRLWARGKGLETIRTAVMRKMLVIAHALVTKERDYDYTYWAA